MKTKWKSQFLRASLAGGIIAAALTGCSTSGGGSFPPSNATAAASGKPLAPPPDVNDCVLISTGSPSKYVCYGKTYTTFELAKLRADYAAQQQSQK
ncbi:MAG TPA: hypothetical protein VJX23_07220 [Candidatus Binataceae bacterium]|nr:hypothetical protein [Candidatus Binataceae bacterium]